MFVAQPAMHVHSVGVPWNPIARREERLVTRALDLLDEFELQGTVSVAPWRREVSVRVPSEPDGLRGALERAVGPRVHVNVTVVRDFEPPVGFVRVSSRDPTQEEKLMLLRLAAKRSSDLPPPVRKEVASRLRRGEDVDSIITWLNEVIPGLEGE